MCRSNPAMFMSVLRCSRSMAKQAKTGTPTNTCLFIYAVVCLVQTHVTPGTRSTTPCSRCCQSPAGAWSWRAASARPSSSTCAGATSTSSRPAPRPPPSASEPSLRPPRLSSRLLHSTLHHPAAPHHALLPRCRSPRRPRPQHCRRRASPRLVCVPAAAVTVVRPQPERTCLLLLAAP